MWFYPGTVDMYTVTHFFLQCLFIIIAAPPSDIAALRKEVKQLMELVESLISEFKAVKSEMQASRLDVDSIRCALYELLEK